MSLHYVVPIYPLPNLRYRSKREDNKKARLIFGIANGQCALYHNFNNQIHQGFMGYHSKNEHSFWFQWQNNWGTILIGVKEHADFSIPDYVQINDGTNPV